METLPDIYPLTSLQIGDIQSYLSRVFLFFAPTSHKLLILVDNRPWLMNTNPKSTLLWQLMVTKYRISPFTNTRTLTHFSDSGSPTLVNRCLVSNSNTIKKFHKWFSVIDAAKWQRKSLFPVTDLRKSLHGFLVFEVEWKDVHGINYLNELQTDTSVALEVRSMRKWDFTSISHALSCTSLWFAGTVAETKVLQYNLKQLSDMKGPAECRQDLSKELSSYDKKLMQKASEDTFFDVEEDLFELNYNIDDRELHIQKKGAEKHAEDFSVSSTRYEDTLLLFRFDNGHLPLKLRKIITSDVRLLTLVESGLPSWALFFQSYPIFCHLYRPWMRPLARTLYILISLVTVIIGFYDLYKNVPLLKAAASSLLGPLFDWIEAWDMISRIRYLGTMLFLQNFEKGVHWVMVVIRVIRPMVILVTKPVMKPLIEALVLISPVWSTFSEIGEMYLSTVWDLAESSCGCLLQILGDLLTPISIVYEYTRKLVCSLHPLAWSIYNAFVLPIRLVSALANYGISIFSEVYMLLRDGCQSIASMVHFIFLFNAKPSGNGVSIWKSISKDLLSQVFRATKIIIYGLVEFLTTCSRHKLSISNHIQAFLYQLAYLFRLSSYPCPCRKIELIEYQMVEFRDCKRCK